MSSTSKTIVRKTRIPVRGESFRSGSSTPTSSISDLSANKSPRASISVSKTPRTNVASRLRAPRPSTSLLRSKSDRATTSNTTSASTSRSSSIDISNKLIRASVSLEKLALFKDYRCFNCNTKDELLSLCANCRQAAYCSKSCQQLHWTEHKPICRIRNPAYFDKTNLEQVQWFIDRTQKLTDAESELANGACSSRSSDHKSTNSSSSSNGDVLPPTILSYLIDSFRLRCFDERQIAAIFPLRPEDVLLKFVRFLHAAKGSRLLVGKLSKSEYYSACNEAFYQHKIAEIASGKGYEHLSATYPDKNKVQHEDLRALHTYICGPIKPHTSDQGIFNII